MRLSRSISPTPRPTSTSQTPPAPAQSSTTTPNPRSSRSSTSALLRATQAPWTLYSLSNSRLRVERPSRCSTRPCPARPPRRRRRPTINPRAAVWCTRRGRRARPSPSRSTATRSSRPNEKFSVALTDPDNAGPEPDNRGEITITDDDATPTPTLNSPRSWRATLDRPHLVFEATLPAPHPAVTFNFRTVTDTAGTVDFDALSGSKLFPANNGTRSHEGADHDQGEGRHCSTSSTRR